MFPSKKTSHLLCTPNQLLGFYVLGTMVLNELNTARHYVWRNCLLTKIMGLYPLQLLGIVIKTKQKKIAIHLLVIKIKNCI